MEPVRSGYGWQAEPNLSALVRWNISTPVNTSRSADGDGGGDLLEKRDQTIKDALMAVTGGQFIHSTASGMIAHVSTWMADTPIPARTAMINTTGKPTDGLMKISAIMITERKASR